VAAFAAREHGYVARAERGAGRRAAQEAQAALYLEEKERRREETAARVAAEGRAKRAMRAVEHEILVQSSFEREAVRRRIMEQLEASQHLLNEKEKEKTQEVTVSLDMGAEFHGGVTEVARKPKLPTHSEAARAANMAEITALRAEAASLKSTEGSLIFVDQFAKAASSEADRPVLYPLGCPPHVGSPDRQLRQSNDLKYLKGLRSAFVSRSLTPSVSCPLG